MLTSLLAGEGASAAAPVADDLNGGAIAAATRDLQAGLAVIHRQLAQPPRTNFGVVPLLCALGLAILLIGPLRLWFQRRLASFLHRSHRHTDLPIYGKALGAVIATAACFACAAGVVLAVMDASLMLVPEVEALTGILFTACVLAGLGLGLGNALRSPDAPDLRPVQLPPGLERTISIYPLAAGLMLGLAAFIDQASRLLQASQTSWTVAQGALVLMQVILIGRFLIHAGRARERQATDAEDGGHLPAIFGLSAIAWAALAIALGALLLGYTRFAMTLLQEMLWGALVLAVGWLAARFLDALVARLLGSDRAAAKFATGIVGVGKSQLEQAGLLISAVLGVAIWLIALLLVLAPLHGKADNIVEQLRPSPILESLRAINLSPRTLLAAGAVLVGGIVATRIVKAWLERRFLPSTRLDAGARNSIVTGLGYFGIVFALLATSTTLGLQLEKITLIASALTVGIGFGLQAIIQNFVSGIILLFERPIRIGDWVSVSGSEGKVRKMRVRATEIVAKDGTIAIVPNSAFISSTVLNRSGSADRLSFDLTIKIAGCSSAEAAKDLLLGGIDTCQAVAQEPEPRLYLTGLGDREWSFRALMRPRGEQSQARATSALLLHLSKLDADGVKISVS